MGAGESQGDGGSCGELWGARGLPGESSQESCMKLVDMRAALVADRDQGSTPSYTPVLHSDEVSFSVYREQIILIMLKIA